MKEYDNKLNKNQIIALIIMGLILICVFILRPDPYREMDQIDQREAEIRIQISNERRMQNYGSRTDRDQSRRDQRATSTAPTTDRSKINMEKFIAY